MKSSRFALFVLATIIGLGALSASKPAAATDWSWLGNKPYIDCINQANFFAGWGGIGKTYTGAEKAARYDIARRKCNRKYYGHD